MDNAIWLIILGVATPVSGFVGFALQLRQVKKMRLENEKLQLEIDELRDRRKKAGHRLVEVSNDDVVKFTRSREWMGYQLPNLSVKGDPRRFPLWSRLTRACSPVFHRSVQYLMSRIR